MKLMKKMMKKKLFEQQLQPILKQKKKIRLMKILKKKIQKTQKKQMKKNKRQLQFKIMKNMIQIYLKLMYKRNSESCSEKQRKFMNWFEKIKMFDLIYCDEMMIDKKLFIKLLHEVIMLK
jgi:hypothetical protein